VSVLLAFGSMFSAAVVSAFLPAVNAEIILLGASAALAPRYAVFLVLAATMGQMVGKSSMFYGARGVKFFQRGRIKQQIDAIDERMTRRHGTVGWFMFVSATTGLPPFYMVSIASGLTGVSFFRFLIAGFAGRFVRFSVVVMFPQLIKAVLA
jgi:membrane protein YqaA with SNARE-associated domain